MFTVNLTGFKELQEGIKNLTPEMKEGLDDVIEVGMKEMKLGAQNAAPKDQGILVGEITYKKNSSLNWQLVSQALYSAYVEFGTRSNVVIPPGVEGDFAVRNAKSSLSAKEAIFNWCKRHGIEQRAWYAIYIKIMTRGIKPHPYFFKQLERERPNILRDAETVLKRLKL